MLGKVAREAYEFIGEINRLTDFFVAGIESGFAEISIGHLAAIAPDRLGESSSDISRKSERLANLANGAARAVMHNGSANSRALARIPLIDILDDFFPALMLEIDIDIGGLIACLRNEARE